MAELQRIKATNPGDNIVAQLREKTINDLQQLRADALKPQNLNTKELADLCKVKPGTVRRSLCVNGHFMGLIPIKLASGRLVWAI